MPSFFERPDPSILLVRTDRMGDLLMTLPAIHALRRAYPQAQLSLLAGKEVVPLLEGVLEVNQILPFEQEPQGWRGIFRWARRLKERRFDGAVIFHPTRLFHAATFLAGIPLRVGYLRKWGFLLTHALADTKAARSLHESQYNLELVNLIGVSTDLADFKFSVPAHRDEEARRLLVAQGLAFDKPLVAIHPWTSNPQKSWQVTSFQQVVNRLLESNLQVLILGGPESMGCKEQFLSGLKPKAVDLVGRVPLSSLPALLSRCSALISNDSGPVHVAAAVGTPAIVVAPREHGLQLVRWRPLGEGHEVLLSPTVEEVVAAAFKRCAS